MAISDVQICNLALDAIGTRSTISQIGEDSAEGKACARHYTPAVEACLRAAHWNFARKQVTLALLKDATTIPPGTVPQPWQYEYSYPSDGLLARSLMFTYESAGNLGFEGWATPAPYGPYGYPAKFVVAQDNDVNGNPIKVILANMSSAQLIYTCRVTNTNLFDAMFVDALTFYLAHRMWSLSGDKAKAKDNYAIAAQLTLQARSMNGNEGVTVIDSVPEWIRVRGYYKDWVYGPGAFWYPPENLMMVV